MSEAEEIVPSGVLSEVLNAVALPEDRTTRVGKELIKFLKYRIESRSPTQSPRTLGILDRGVFNGWREHSVRGGPLQKESFRKEVAGFNKLLSFAIRSLHRVDEAGKHVTILFVGDKSAQGSGESYTPEWVPADLRRAPAARPREGVVGSVSRVRVEAQPGFDLRQLQAKLDRAEFERRLFRLVAMAAFEEGLESDEGALTVKLRTIRDFHETVDRILSLFCPDVLADGELAYFAYELPIHVGVENKDSISRFDTNIKSWNMRIALTSHRRGKLGQNFPLADSSNSWTCYEHGWANPQVQTAEPATTYQRVPGGEAYFRAFPVSLPNLQDRQIAVIGISAARKRDDQEQRFRRDGQNVARVIGWLASLVIRRDRKKLVADCRAGRQKAVRDWKPRQERGAENDPERSWYLAEDVEQAEPHAEENPGAEGKPPSPTDLAAAFCLGLARYYDERFGFDIDESAACDVTGALSVPHP